MIWQVAVGLLVGLLLCWAALILVLWRVKPSDLTVAEAVRVLPDVLGLVTRLARDPSLPRRIRVYLWLLLAYLALPIDLVPDFIPVLGYADDAIVVVLALRAVVRVAGGNAVERHWKGSEAGLESVLRLSGATNPA